MADQQLLSSKQVAQFAGGPAPQVPSPCRQLYVVDAETVPMSDEDVVPAGVQVADPAPKSLDDVTRTLSGPQPE